MSGAGRRSSRHVCRADVGDSRIERKSVDALLAKLHLDDVVAANRLRSETLLYPMDALILAAADSSDCPLVTFDSELLDHGAVAPRDLE